jgi:hypothetical protein
MVDILNPVAPFISRIGEDQLPAGASTLSSNRIFANLYDPDDPNKKDVGIHFIAHFHDCR